MIHHHLWAAVSCPGLPWLSIRLGKIMSINNSCPTFAIETSADPRLDKITNAADYHRSNGNNK